MRDLFGQNYEIKGILLKIKQIMQHALQMQKYIK
jgi:hypothetical protein